MNSHDRMLAECVAKLASVATLLAMNDGHRSIDPVTIATDIVEKACEQGKLGMLHQCLI